jgi:hypothetical protein
MRREKGRTKNSARSFSGRDAAAAFQRRAARRIFSLGILRQSFPENGNKPKTISLFYHNFWKP